MGDFSLLFYCQSLFSRCPLLVSHPLPEGERIMVDSKPQSLHFEFESTLGFFGNCRGFQR